MRFLHTADWHLGATLHGISLLSDQAAVLTQIVEIARTEMVNFVLVAGDVFDRVLPSPDAVALLDDTLAKLILDLDIPTFVIAGNHDSPSRLEFGARIFRQHNLHVIGRFEPSKCLEPTRIGCKDNDKIAAEVYCVPYLSAQGASAAYSGKSGLDQPLSSREAFVRFGKELFQSAAWNSNPNARRILLAHGLVGGTVAVGSDRRLPIGVQSEEDLLPNETLREFDYVALGHLHRAQDIHTYKTSTDLGGATIRYSGSPLAYSFAEVFDQKSVTIVDCPEDLSAPCVVREISLRANRPLAVVRGEFVDLIESGPDHPSRDLLVKIELLDDHTVLDAVSRLREYFPNLLHLERTPRAKGTDRGDSAAAIDLANEKVERSPRELFHQFYHETTGQELSESQGKLLREYLP